jgi:FlaA1/EpsC-like NDP-sugar epimerase
MTIPEACTLILKAWKLGEKNDLFVLDMGESIKIYELAKILIILNGYIPEEEIKIDIIGLRPGEKLYEEILVSEEETNATNIDKIFKTKNYMDFNISEYEEVLDLMFASIFTGSDDSDYIIKYLEKLVPTFKHIQNT